jgi:hypothetical protein
MCYCAAQPLQLTAGLASSFEWHVIPTSELHNVMQHWWVGLWAWNQPEGCLSYTRKLWLGLPRFITYVWILWVLMVNEKDATPETDIYSEGWCMKPTFHLLRLSGTKNSRPVGDNWPKCQSTHTLSYCALYWASVAPVLHKFFVVEMLCNNFMNQRMRNFRKFLVNFIKSKTVLINPGLQIFSDEGQVPRLSLIVNLWSALIKHSTPLSHIWLIRYTFPIHCNKLTVNFNWIDISCIQKPNYSSHFTTNGILDFLTQF